jgi:hypothetical protein
MALLKRNKRVVSVLTSIFRQTSEQIKLVLNLQSQSGVHVTLRILNGKGYQKTYHLKVQYIFFAVVFLFLDSEE